MTDNPQPASNREFPLPGHRVLVLEGRDATAFAQAQFMNDVAALAVGHWQWNGWLTPKGRLIALFALLKLSGDRLWLLLADADPAELALKLQRFVFRSKVALTVHGDARVIGAFAAPGQASGSAIQHRLMIDRETAELDMGGDGGARTLRIMSDDLVRYDAVALASDALRWAAFDLEHGLPRLPPLQAEQWTPQMLSLDRLRAFSVKKGCYPGQEIVARTHFLGQTKRGLVLFDTDTPVAVGSEVRDGERALGTVVSVEANLALAVLPLEREAAALHVDGVVVSERPLLGGLAR